MPGGGVGEFTLSRYVDCSDGPQHAVSLIACWVDYTIPLRERKQEILNGQIGKSLAGWKVDQPQLGDDGEMIGDAIPFGDP